MPTHIIIIGNISNFIVFSFPVLISVIVYINLTREGQKRKLEIVQEVFSVQTHHSTRPRVDNSEASESNSVHCGGYTVEDLPYPLNAIQENINHSQHSVEQFGNPGTSSNLPPFHAMPETLLSSNGAEPNAEIDATLRSMKTNFLMLLLFLLSTFLFFIPIVYWKMFVACFVQSLIKLFLPTITTISNFGPVKKVVKLYLENLKAKLAFREH